MHKQHGTATRLPKRRCIHGIAQIAPGTWRKLRPDAVFPHGMERRLDLRGRGEWQTARSRGCRPALTGAVRMQRAVEIARIALDSDPARPRRQAEEQDRIWCVAAEQSTKFLPGLGITHSQFPARDKREMSSGVEARYHPAHQCCGRIAAHTRITAKAGDQHARRAASRCPGSSCVGFGGCVLLGLHNHASECPTTPPGRSKLRVMRLLATQNLSFVVAVLALPLLAACSSRPPAALTPVVSVADARIVDLLVSTTRRPSSDPAVLFGGDRTLTPRFARLSISIPPGHKTGDIAWSPSTIADPRTSFATTRAAVLEPQAFRSALRQQIHKTGRSHVLVFVHGYNTRFDEAAFRFAQIVHDSNSPVTPVLYSWASWGSLSAYPYDRSSAAIARDGLEKLLADVASDPAVGEVSVLAHSMGGWLAMESLRQMAIRNRQVAPKIRNLMLAAPDIDVDVAQEQARGLGTKRPRITLFVSRDDEALKLSNIFWGSRDRLGAIDPAKEPYRSNLKRFGVEVIDLTNVETSDRTGHGKFAQSPEVVRAIGSRLASGQQLSVDTGDIGDGAAMLTQGAFGAVGRLLTTPLTIGRDSEGPREAGAITP